MGRTAGYKKNNYTYRMDAYVQGNTVRKSQSAYAVPVRQPEREIKPRTSAATRSNRAKALQMDLAYVGFLAVAAIATLFVCINFLQLRSQNTNYRNRVSSLEAQVSSLKMENDAAYKDAVASVDLEAVKERATKELGMVYAREGQIITFEGEEGDYVKQYQDVPTE